MTGPLAIAVCCREWPVDPLSPIGRCGFCGERPVIDWLRAVSEQCWFRRDEGRAAT
jgi:hypothetical protein